MRKNILLLLIGFFCLFYTFPAFGQDCDTVNLGVHVGSIQALNCSLRSTTLEATISSDYTDLYWQPVNGGHIVSGGDTPNPVVDAAGKYILVVTDANGCINSDVATVIDTTLLGSANAGPTQVISCLGDVVQLDGSLSENVASFEWLTDDGHLLSDTNTLQPMVDQAGTYVLSITTATGCQYQDTVLVFPPIPLIAEALPDWTINCDNTAVNISAEGSIGAVRYEWTTDNGRFVSPTDSVIVVVDTPGIYTLTVYNEENCSASTEIEVFEDFELPGFDIQVSNNGVLDCQNELIYLDASQSTHVHSYEWKIRQDSGHFINEATDSILIVDKAGFYELTLSTPGWCMDSRLIEITDVRSYPKAYIQIPHQLDCTHSTVTLSAFPLNEEVARYEWITDDGHIVSGANTPYLVVDAPGIYTLTIYNEAGCSNELVAEVHDVATSIIIDEPIVEILNCEVPLFQITTNSLREDLIYEWTTSDGVIDSESNTPTIVVSSSGEYLLTVSNSEGCSISRYITIEPYENLPKAVIKGVSTLSCYSPILQLYGDESLNAVSYEWSTLDGSIATDTTQANIVIDAVGTYDLYVTAANGCTHHESITIVEDMTLPIAQVTGVQAFSCSIPQLTLYGTTSTDAVAYEWLTTDGNIIGTTDADSIIIDRPGTYQLIVTAANGCRDQQEVLIGDLENEPIAQFTGVTQLNCRNPDVILNASSSVRAVSYEWFTDGGRIIGNPSDTIIILDWLGIYGLTVTNEEGCTDTYQILITADYTYPIANIADSDTILNCYNNHRIRLDGTSPTEAVSYRWFTPNGAFNGDSIAPIIEVTQAGTYQLLVEAFSGCVSSTEVIITEELDPIARVTGAAQLDCNTTSIMLDGSSSENHIIYTWTTTDGSILGSPTNANIIVDEPGTYQLEVTAHNGCTDTQTVVIERDVTPPIAEISGAQQLTCGVTSIVLNGINSTDVAAYAWSSPTGSILGDTSNSFITIDEPGTYQLMITAANGCTDIQRVVIGRDVAPPTANITGVSQLNCNTTSLILNGQSSINAVTYLWSTSDGSILTDPTLPFVTLDEPGTYELEIIAPNGCMDTQTVLIGRNITPPTAEITGIRSLNCSMPSLVLNGQNSTDAINYQWTTENGNIISQSTADTISVDQAGTYRLTVTAANGCTDSQEAIIGNDNTLPTANITGAAQLNCNTTSLVLEGSNSLQTISYQWSTIDGNITSSTTANSINIDSPGSYQLEVMASSGCTDIQTVVIGQDVDNRFDTLTAMICTGNSVIVAGTTYNTGGIYQDTIFGVANNGCDSVLNITIIEYPIIRDTFEVQICDGEAYIIDGIPQSSSGTYTTNAISSNGCDSIVTIQLTVGETTEVYLNAQICDGDSYNFFGTNLTNAGTFTTASQGVGIDCDTLYILELSVDDRPPMLPILRDTILDCPFNVPPPTQTNDMVALVSIDEIVRTDPCDYTLIRTWIATDSCGNSSTSEQLIQWIDTIPPSTTIEHPNFENLASGDTILVAVTEFPLQNEFILTPTDACDNSASVNEVSATTNFQDCFYATTYVWESRDICDNTDTIQIVVYVEDTLEPSLVNVPNDTTVTSLSEVPDVPTLLAVDDVDLNPTIALVQDTFTDGCNYLFVRTWYVSDKCDNTKVFTQSITVPNAVQFFNLTLSTQPAECNQSDGQATLGPDQYTFTWEDGFIGNARSDLAAGTYLVVATLSGCRDSINILIPEVNCTNSNTALTGTFESNEIELDCQAADMTYCLDIPFHQLRQYQIWHNDTLFNNFQSGCETSASLNYPYGLLENTLTGEAASLVWQIGEDTFLGKFETIEELTALLNNWDANNNWSIDTTQRQIINTAMHKNYGDLQITIPSTSITTIIALNENTSPLGTQIKLTAGQHEWILHDTVHHIMDTLFLNVRCVTPHTEEPTLEEQEETEEEQPTVIIPIPQINALSNDIAQTRSNQSVSIDVLNNDDIDENTNIELSIYGQPTQGNARVIANKYVEFVPPTNFCDNENAVLIEYMVCDSLNCLTALIEITILCDQLKVYNGFSPNNDGINDYFMVEGLDFIAEDTYLFVFNRWGQRVYQATNYTNNWSGLYKNAPLPDGSYFYVLKTKERVLAEGYVEIRK